MLAEGIASEDRRIVDLTVLDLNVQSPQHGPDLRWVQAHPWSSTRPIAEVRALQRVLISCHAQVRFRPEDVWE